MVMCLVTMAMHGHVPCKDIGWAAIVAVGGGGKVACCAALSERYTALLGISCLCGWPRRAAAILSVMCMASPCLHMPCRKAYMWACTQQHQSSLMCAGKYAIGACREAMCFCVCFCNRAFSMSCGVGCMQLQAWHCSAFSKTSPCITIATVALATAKESSSGSIWTGARPFD